MENKEVYPNPQKDMKILDAGAGTGGIGEMLKARGYTNIDALDISQEMLNLAAAKNLYKNLICAPLKDTHMEEIETAEYDTVLCAGTIVYGQVKPGAIEQCARFVKPGMLSFRERFLNLISSIFIEYALTLITTTALRIEVSKLLWAPFEL